MSRTVLVIGASGKTGRAVTAALLRRGVRVRAAGRSLLGTNDRNEPARDLAGVRSASVPESSFRSVIPSGEVAGVDLETGAGLEEAMAGVDAVYHLAPNVHPDEVGMARRVVSAARAAGVDRFVFHSVLHPHDERMPHHLRKGAAEEVIRAELPGATVLRPAAYHQNLLGAALAGRIAVPYSLEVPFTNVDLDDVAEVAAHALTEDGHDGATYDLAGDETLTVRELARIASEVLHRPVDAERVPLQDWLSGAGSSLDEDRRAVLLAMFAAYDADGFVGDGTTLTALLDRRQTPWRDVLDRERSLLGGA